MDAILTIIMCAYNEMGRIQRAVAEVLASIERRQEPVEVIVLDNCSTDGTREWLESLNRPGIRVVLNETNLGKGGSVRKGIELSSGRYVVIHDPDLEYSPDDVWRLLELAQTSGASMVLGSRVLGGQVKYEYLQNYLGVVLLTWAINLLYGCRITDAATAMKLMDGELVRSLRLERRGFDLDFELVSRIARVGGRMAEVRIDYEPRTKEEGKKIRAWRDGLLALRAILEDRLVPVSRLWRDKPLTEASFPHSPERQATRD